MYKTKDKEKAKIIFDIICKKYMNKRDSKYNIKETYCIHDIKNNDYFIAIRKNINDHFPYFSINSIALDTELKLIEKENIGIYNFIDSSGYILNDDLEIIHKNLYFIL